jgi:hypothetical protein
MENTQLMPAGYTWSVTTGLNNGVGPAPVWVTTLASGLAVEVWENLEGTERYTAQAVKPAAGYTPGSLYPAIDESWEPEFTVFTAPAQLGSWLADLA